MAHDVFVSYSQKDKPVADAVVARLEQEAIRCWMAPRDITPGTSWGEAIVDAIAGSRVMVLVLSANSNRSRQVIREVERAVAADVIILPFRIDNMDPTGAMAYFLGTEHWLDALTPPLEKHIDRLSRTVETLISGDPVARDDLDKPPAAVARSRRRPRLPIALMIGAVTAVAAVAITLALTLGGDETPGTTLPATDTSAATTSATVIETTMTTPTTIPVALEEVGGYQPMDLDPTDLQPPDVVTGFDIEGSMLVFSNGIDGVTRASIGDPAEPRPMETFAAYDAQAVAFDGEWMYAITGEHNPEVLIFNVEGTGGITLPWESDGITSLHDVEVVDGVMYLSGHNYVGIVDVTDPSAPEAAYEWEPPGSTGNPASTFVADGVGYFGAGWDGLYLFDVTDPYHPAALGHWVSPNWVVHIAVSDGIAYVTLGDTGLATLDVGDPQRPVMLGLVELPGFASRVDIAHGHAFVSWFGEGGTLGGVAVVDVHDPETPVFLNTYGRLQTITGLEISGDHLFIAEESLGIIVFEITGIG